MKNFDGKKILIGLLVFVVVFSSVYSLFKGSYASESTGGTGTDVNGKLVLNCDNSVVSASGTIVCTLQGTNFTTQVSSITAKLILDSNLSLQDITFVRGEETAESWQGSVSDGQIDLYTDVNKTGTFDIAEITLEASSNTSVNSNIVVDQIFISDEKFVEYEMSDVSLAIRIASSDANLSSLTVTGTDFEFNPDITSYNLTIDAQQVTITATASSDSVSIAGDGEKVLHYGLNEFEIVVTAEDSTTKTYTLLITRPDKLVFDDSILVKDNYLIFNLDVDSDGNIASMETNDLLDKINTSGSVTVKTSYGNVASESDPVGTGYTVSISIGGSVRTYTIIVLGDINGDGNVDVIDVGNLFQKYRNKNYDMNDVYSMAGDVMSDSDLKLTDVAKLYQFIRKKISSLN